MESYLPYALPKINEYTSAKTSPMLVTKIPDASLISKGASATDSGSGSLDASAFRCMDVSVLGLGSGSVVGFVGVVDCGAGAVIEVSFALFGGATQCCMAGLLRNSIEAKRTGNNVGARMHIFNRRLRYIWWAGVVRIMSC